MNPKDYLTYENERNRKHAVMYETLLRLALGPKWQILTGHHFLYEYDGDVNTEGEFPSADTLCFDHDIMKAVFGEQAVPLMRELASVPCGERDDLLAVAIAGKLPVVWPPKKQGDEACAPE